MNISANKYKLALLAAVATIGLSSMADSVAATSSAGKPKGQCKCSKGWSGQTTLSECKKKAKEDRDAGGSGCTWSVNLIISDPVDTDDLDY